MKTCIWLWNFNSCEHFYLSLLLESRIIKCFTQAPHHMCLQDLGSVRANPQYCFSQEKGSHFQEAASTWCCYKGVSSANYKNSSRWSIILRSREKQSENSMFFYLPNTYLYKFHLASKIDFYTLRRLSYNLTVHNSYFILMLAFGWFLNESYEEKKVNDLIEKWLK